MAMNVDQNWKNVFLNQINFKGCLMLMLLMTKGSVQKCEAQRQTVERGAAGCLS